MSPGGSACASATSTGCRCRPTRSWFADGVVACTLADRYPLVPQAFLAADAAQLRPLPQVPGLVAVVVALGERAAREAMALALAHEIITLDG